MTDKNREPASFTFTATEWSYIANALRMARAYSERVAVEFRSDDDDKSETFREVAEETVAIYDGIVNKLHADMRSTYGTTHAF